MKGPGCAKAIAEDWCTEKGSVTSERFRGVYHSTQSCVISCRLCAPESSHAHLFYVLRSNPNLLTLLDPWKLGAYELSNRRKSTPITLSPTPSGDLSFRLCSAAAIVSCLWFYFRPHPYIALITGAAVAAALYPIYPCLPATETSTLPSSYKG